MARRYIERPADQYSLRTLLDELRNEARSYWGTMHSARRAGHEHIELSARANLANALRLLNASRGCGGSYDRAYFRRIDRELAEITRVAA